MSRIIAGYKYEDLIEMDQDEVIEILASGKVGAEFAAIEEEKNHIEKKLESANENLRIVNDLKNDLQESEIGYKKEISKISDLNSKQADAINEYNYMSWWQRLFFALSGEKLKVAK